jgi:hypothetical protein
LRGLGGVGRGKENDREEILLKHIASVYEDGITEHSESC